MIYLPIETSGEGEINAHSRVQMALGEAKVKAKTGDSRGSWKRPACTLDEVRAYVGKHPELQAASLQGAARQGRGRHRPRISSSTSRTA